MKARIYDTGIGRAWLERLASGTKQEGAFKAALLSLAQQETVKKKILREAAEALRYFVDEGWRLHLDNVRVGCHLDLFL